MIKRAERRIFISSLYIDSSESELVRHFHSFCSFQWFNDIDFYAGNPSSRNIWFESLSFTWSKPFNASWSILRNKNSTPSITRLSITCAHFHVSKSQLAGVSCQNSSSTFQRRLGDLACKDLWRWRWCYDQWVRFRETKHVFALWPLISIQCEFKHILLYEPTRPLSLFQCRKNSRTILLRFYEHRREILLSAIA